ncbi:MAG: endonuclease MutS2, partial [Lachnospiraceae bacterium]|nr:endonuclease MutS2 [Lachnospiraceae bacterium]
MNERSLRILEYNKIKEMLTSYAGSEQGKKLCRELEPLTEKGEIERLQTETSDALSRLFASGNLSFSGLKDISGQILRLGVGGSLGMKELLDIASSLDTALRVRSYGKKDDEEREDSLAEMFSMLQPCSNLSREIRRCIINEDEMADDASPGLKAARRSIRLTNDRIKQHLGSLLTSSTMKDKLQDAIVTMRSGRYCLPVKSEYRSQVPGMIHDQSSTGATVFI